MTCPEQTHARARWFVFCLFLIASIAIAGIVFLNNPTPERDFGASTTSGVQNDNSD